MQEEPYCRYCGAPSSQVDHITPVVEGGITERDNLQGLCRRCHNMKTGREAARARKRRSE